MPTRRTTAADNERLSGLMNLGPAMERMLITVGIKDATDLEQIGAVEAYARLREAGYSHINRVGLWALTGALFDIHWNALPSELRQRVEREAEDRLG